MTKKHYTELAKELAWLLSTASAEEAVGIRGAIHILCVSLKAENRAFDKERFLTACGL
jgi:hypothetical protein